MKKSRKILLGIATIWPLFYILLFVIALAVTFLTIDQGASEDAAIPTLLMFIIPLHFLTIFLAIGMLIFYIVQAVRNERIPKDQKPLWVVALFFGSIIAMSVYWYIHIWKDVEIEEEDRELLTT